MCAGTAPTSATLQPFSFSPGQSNKLSKFEGENFFLHFINHVQYVRSDTLMWYQVFDPD